MDDIRTLDDLIDALGGTAAAASKAGVSPPAVSNWRSRGRVPPEHFLRLSDEVGKLGRRLDPSLFGFSPAEARA